MKYTVTVTPNHWSKVMTSEGVYYAQVPFAEARRGMVINSAKVMVDITSPITKAISVGTLTILKAKVYDGELIFFARVRPEDAVNIEIDLDKDQKSSIILT